MEKPKTFIRWEKDGYYTWGVLHFGRVEIPTFVLSAVYGAVFLVLITLAAIFQSLTLAIVATSMLLLMVGLGALFFIGLFIWWVLSSIRINGPES